jgi:NADH-quinone oxidoreductase subunit H
MLLFLSLYLGTIAPLLLSVAFFTLAERKIIAAIQRRKGPNRLYPFGFLQPIADGLKAILKEMVFPTRIEFFIFILSPWLTFFISLWGWCLIPFDISSVIADFPLSFLMFFVVSGLGFYGVLLAGWSSNSKYAIFSTFRALAQLISYEIFISLAILPILFTVGNFNLISIVFEQRTGGNLVPFLPLLVIFFIACLAETNRTPFDLPEAEAEIVAGYNIEYSGFIFALFFLGEYSNMILNAIIIVIIFLGGWLPILPVWSSYSLTYYGLVFDNTFNIAFLILKLLFLCFLWIFVRACLPRFRYDQLMILGWNIYLPLTLSFFFMFFIMQYCFGKTPMVQQIPLDIWSFN